MSISRRLTAAAVLAAAVCLSSCGDSPTMPTPTSTTATPPVQTPALVITRFVLPVGTTHGRIVAQTQPGSCHTFRVLLEAKVLVDEVVGDCPAAHGMIYDKMHALTGGQAEVQTTPLNNTMTWSITSE